MFSIDGRDRYRIALANDVVLQHDYHRYMVSRLRSVRYKSFSENLAFRALRYTPILGSARMSASEGPSSCWSTSPMVARARGRFPGRVGSSPTTRRSTPNYYAVARQFIKHVF